MIHINELRIGNLFDFYDEIKPVIALDSYHDRIAYGLNEDSGYFWCYLDEAFPIPLTDRWMIKFGKRKKNDISDNYILKLGLEIVKGEEGWEMLLGKDEIIVATIQYVHQLQNLYFALMGEELKLVHKV